MKVPFLGWINDFLVERYLSPTLDLISSGGRGGRDASRLPNPRRGGNSSQKEKNCCERLNQSGRKISLNKTSSNQSEQLWLAHPAALSWCHFTQGCSKFDCHERLVYEEERWMNNFSMVSRVKRGALTSLSARPPPPKCVRRTTRLRKINK